MRTRILVGDKVVTTGVVVEAQLVLRVVVAPCASPLHLLVRQDCRLPRLVEDFRNAPPLSQVTHSCVQARCPTWSASTPLIVGACHHAQG